MNFVMPSILLVAALMTGQSGPLAVGELGLLDAQLRHEDPVVLARDARRLGDARRGALVFHQPTLMCTGCHLNDGGATASLGPDLTEIRKNAPDFEIVEAILEPSKTIRKISNT